MQFVLVSGLSGSGKSIALAVLEDAGYYCVDNIPVKLLPETLALLEQTGTAQAAVSVDARSGSSLEEVPLHIEALRRRGIEVRVLFLDTKNDTLIKRFSETRRRHPLARGERTLEEALAIERELLAPLAEIGHRIDTSDLSPNTLRNWIKDLLGTSDARLTLLLESFGFKQGIPLDANLVFDVRCLPNPHYDSRLRPLTGRDRDVVAFLEREPQVEKMFRDILAFAESWLPAYERDNRSYFAIAIGCTGGQHRSVYLVERIAAHFRQTQPVLVRHRQLPA